jgi:hypothetical protein
MHRHIPIVRQFLLWTKWFLINAPLTPNGFPQIRRREALTSKVGFVPARPRNSRARPAGHDPASLPSAFLFGSRKWSCPFPAPFPRVSIGFPPVFPRVPVRFRRETKDRGD